MSEAQPITVVIVDDHSLFSRGLELLLNAVSEGRIHVAGRTEKAEDAVALVRRHRPQVAVVDLAMPPPGGLGAIREITRHYPEVRILALSGTDDKAMALEALAAGAVGFIPKSSDPDVLVPPLLTLGGGLSVLPPSLLGLLLDSMAKRSPARLAALDDNEVCLWGLVAKGLESADIAERIFVSERTAKRLVAALLRKLEVSNRVEAALMAGRVGLLDDETG